MMLLHTSWSECGKENSFFSPSFKIIIWNPKQNDSEYVFVFENIIIFKSI